MYNYYACITFSCILMIKRKSMSYLSKFRLEGKVALITGASKGIGEAMAEALAEAGAKVIVSSRKQDAVEEVAENIRKKGAEATAIAANVGDEDSMKALVESSVAKYGGVDILINNAAANPVFGPLTETEPWAFDKIMNVNVKGPFLLAKMLHPIMKSRGGGSVINISSVGGLRPEQGLGIYSVSKAALISLTKVMAKEWGKDNIRANVICPGLVKTKFSEALWSNEKIVGMMMKMQPLQWIAEPEDMGGLALFLASDASKYITGAVYTADGGFTI
jgi:NAD(P)-dependent dehydrogenase (short-subunit alcohol dehydrogenase family)